MAKGAVIQIKELGGRVRTIGRMCGDTFTAFERDERRHLFRGAAETADEALADRSASWGLDLAVMEALRSEHGVRYVVIPTAQGRTYRVTMDALLGPKSFVKEFSGHRPQVFLGLDHWVTTP